MNNPHLRSTLNGLIHTCKDGEEGFRAAAENMDDEDTQKLLTEYSLGRARFVEELQSAVEALGDSDPEDSGTVTGAVHRGWIDLKAALLDGDPHAILVECERGEGSAVADYETALKGDLAANVREMISRQYAAVLQAHEAVRKLSDAGGPTWA